MTQETVLVNARVSKSFKRRARIVAAFEGLSLSEWLRRAMEEKVTEGEAIFLAPGDSRVNQSSKDEIIA